jgi:hypothetical protein
MLLDVVSDFTKVQAHSPNKIHVVCFFEERTCDVYAILGMEGKRVCTVSFQKDIIITNCQCSHSWSAKVLVVWTGYTKSVSSGHTLT